MFLPFSLEWLIACWVDGPPDRSKPEPATTLRHRYRLGQAAHFAANNSDPDFPSACCLSCFDRLILKQCTHVVFSNLIVLVTFVGFDDTDDCASTSTPEH